MRYPKLRIIEAVDSSNKRKGEKKSVADLASEVESDLNVTTIINYFSQSQNGTRPLPLDLLIEVCKKTNTSSDFVLGLSDNPDGIKQIAKKISDLSGDLSHESHKLNKEINSNNE